MFQLLFPSILSTFYAEFVAGVLGILIGLSFERSWERHKEQQKKQTLTKQIIDRLTMELHGNLLLIEENKSKIKPSDIVVSSSSHPFGYPIPYFFLFKTSVWDMFKSEFELDPLDLVFDLTDLYHDLNLFNEAMKNESYGVLSNFLRRNPNFLEQLDKELKMIVNALESISKTVRAL